MSTHALRTSKGGFHRRAVTAFRTDLSELGREVLEKRRASIWEALMVQLLDPRHPVSLDDYESIAHLGPAVRELRQEARSLLPVLEGRGVWTVNSARRGGGVAELLPPLLALLRELGVDAGWLVMEPGDAAFFRLTKRLHNLVHGWGDAGLGSAERELYDRISRDTAEEISGHLRPRDMLVVHDPQPLGAGATLRGTMDIAAIWRCHIGLDRKTPETRAAWAFLDDYATAYDHAVFTAPQYIPVV